MSKKFLSFLGFASLILLMAACEKNPGVEEQQPQEVVYTAIMEQPTFVRSTVDLTASTVVWTTGEEIGVIKNDGSAIVDVALKVDPRGKATFTLMDDVTPSVAVYPKIAKTYTDGNLTAVTLPATYGDASAAYAEACYAPMYADMSGTSKIINFKQLGGILTIVLTKVPAGVDQMVFTAAGKQIAGDFNVDLTASEPSIAAASGDSNNSVSWVFAATTEEQDMNFYIPLPVGTYEDMQVELKAGETVVSTLKPAVQSIEMNRNTLAFFEVDYSVNLSADDQTANCYIVSGAGDYKFRATHKGHSLEDADKLAEIKSVAVLWESKGIDIATAKGDLITKVEYNFGYIKFTATEHEGNAVIAAYDGPNASGNILWSWHIWMTDAPQAIELNNNQGQLLDRNIGATAAEATAGSLTYGLYYQWGRKDPFPAKRVDTSVGEDGWKVEATSSEVGTVEYAIKHPTTFIKNPESDKANWMFEPNNTLWMSNGDVTIYNPCPAGWAVPTGNDGTFVKAFGDTSGKAYPDWDDKNKGRDFGGSEEGKVYLSSSSCWFPATGYLRWENGNFSSYGGSGYYWTTGLRGTKPTYDGCAFGFKNSAVWNKNNRGRAMGHSVRCWKAPVAAAE